MPTTSRSGRLGSSLARARLIAAVLAGLAGVAHAHQSSITYSEAVVDGAAVDYTIRIAAGDLAEPIGRAPSAAVPVASISADEWRRLAAYVTARIEIADGAVVCAVRDASAAAEGDAARVRWRAECPAPIARLTIRYRLFFDLDPAHNGALRVAAGDRHADTLLVAGAATFAWELRAPPPSGALAFVRAGVHHVATGPDHIAFVLALLLALVLIRTPGGWGLRPIGASLRATAAVVSAFTVAHSLTLIAAALGYVALPSRLVECLIAASIAWTAVADVVRPDGRWRFAATFGFGLVHGLGFARMLTPLLPRDQVVVPLLCFNLGVELAQLAIVAVALPAAWLLARGLGARRYRTAALPILAGALAMVGLIWLVERAFGVVVLGW